MKILIVNKFLYLNGGSETYILKIGEQLKASGHDVQFFGMEHDRMIMKNNLNVYTSNMDFHTGKLDKLIYPFKIIYSYEARKKIRQVLESFKPDVVHLNNFNFQLTPSIIYEIRAFEKKCNQPVKIIYTAHDSQLVCPNHLMQQYLSGVKCRKCAEGNVWNCARFKCIHGSRVKSILGSLEGFLYRILRTYDKIDVIISPSMFLKEVLDSQPVLAKKTRVLCNFVEEKTISQVLRKTDYFSKDYIIYFGRYSEEKGIRNLIEICKELPEIPFVFAGSGPLEKELEGIPNIKNLGFLTGEELYQQIANARFSLFTSECYENCPFTVMESQMCQTPIIAANIGGAPELIQNGKTGELYESGNKEELKEKIISLWKDSEKTREYAENCKTVKFDSVKEYCDKLMMIYKEHDC